MKAIALRPVRIVVLAVQLALAFVILAYKVATGEADKDPIVQQMNLG